MKNSVKVLLYSAVISALPLSAGYAAEISACFTPGENCTAQIVHQINTARKSVYVQAYGFTSTPIANALVNAKRRGVTIFTLLDKSNPSSKYSKEPLLNENKIPVLIDYKPAIAHNKVMIIDQREVITGSFNFTASAQKRNAENVVFITKDPQLVSAFMANFEKRKNQSVSEEAYLARSGKKGKHYRHRSENNSLWEHAKRKWRESTSRG